METWNTWVMARTISVVSLCSVWGGRCRLPAPPPLAHTFWGFALLLLLSTGSNTSEVDLHLGRSEMHLPKPLFYYELTHSLHRQQVSKTLGTQPKLSSLVELLRIFDFTQRTYKTELERTRRVVSSRSYTLTKQKPNTTPPALSADESNSPNR